MKNKILFVDIDKTLLRDDRTVTEENRRAIHKMLDEGHYIALATGRTVESGRLVIRELGLTRTGCYMVAFNGAVLYDCAADRILLKRSMPIEVVQEIFERAERAGIYAQTYTNTDIAATRHTKELDYYKERTQLSYKLSPNILDILEEEPQKVILICLERKERLLRFRNSNREWEKGKCTSFFSCPEDLDYCPIGTSKGTGVEYLTRILNMPKESTVAVGDEQNDIPMLEAAHLGIAVSNAIPEVKNVADYVTENDNNHSAIAEVIEKFIL